MKPVQIQTEPNERTDKQVILLSDPEAVAIISGWFNGPLETEKYKIVYAVSPEDQAA